MKNTSISTSRKPPRPSPLRVARGGGCAQGAGGARRVRDGGGDAHRARVEGGGVGPPRAGAPFDRGAARARGRGRQRQGRGEGDAPATTRRSSETRAGTRALAFPAVVCHAFGGRREARDRDCSGRARPSHHPRGSSRPKAVARLPSPSSTGACTHTYENQNQTNRD